MCIAHLSTVGVSEAKNKYQWSQQIVCRGGVLRMSSGTGVTHSSCMGVSVPYLALLKACFICMTITIVAESLATILNVHLQ